MASVDALDEVTAFAKEHDANFPILSDATKETSDAYGVLSPIGFAKRWTFYIDKSGAIVSIDKNVNPRSAGSDLDATLSRLNL
jgi:thioredoxin-dependent peroxiredoxin